MCVCVGGYICKIICKMEIDFTRINKGIIDIYLTGGMSIFMGDVFLGDDFGPQILTYGKYTWSVSLEKLLESEIKNLWNKPKHLAFFISS